MLDAGAAPDFLSISGLLKAMPQQEGGQRIVYFEASNEGLDQQSEIVSAKALAESADYYLRYGNVDLEHWTITGRPNPAKGYPGLPDFMSYEIGQPVDVRQSGKTTFVKSVIKQGDSAACEQANRFWASLMSTPPTRWYPSVGGAVLEKSTEVDPRTGAAHTIISKVRWTNIGVSLTPVNQHVPGAATVPIGAFAKSMTASGALDLTKALTAGYGTDSATLTGGSALRGQSLDGGMRGYFDWRDAVSGAIRDGSIRVPNAEGIVAFSAKKFGMQLDAAAEWTDRFLRDLSARLKRSKT